MNNIVQFNNQNLELIQHNGQSCLTQCQISGALGYERLDQIAKLYKQYQAEFTEEMTCLIKPGRTRIRIFNRDGAWLIGMFARTPKAAEFRKWVLKVLGAVAERETLKQVQGGTTTVREHIRSLPTGKKEIVLSAKAKEEIGGITKDVVIKALDEKLPQYLGYCEKLSDELISDAFRQVVDEIQALKALELKDYRLSSFEAEIVNKIRSAGASNMLNFYMGVSKKFSA